MDKFCGECGKPISNEDLFCAECGTKVGREDDVKDKKNREVDDLKSGKLSRSKKIWGTILGIIICIIAIGLLSKIFKTNKSDEKLTNNNVEVNPPTIHSDENSSEKILNKPAKISNKEIENFISLYVDYLMIKNIDGILSCYANEVDYFGVGKMKIEFIKSDKINYYKSWDSVNYWLMENSLSISDLPNNAKSVVFNMGYYVYNTIRDKSSEGIAENTLKIRRGNNKLEIYDEKQRIISSNTIESTTVQPKQIENADQNKSLNEYATNNSEELLQTENELPIYLTTAEEMPEPIGGINAILGKIVYPEIAKRAGIEGKVYILAFVNESGSVTKAQLLKGIGAGCDEAALDAVQKTKFKPGKQKGELVKVQVSIPIIFKLQ